MGLLTQLQTNGSNYSQFDGVTPPNMPSASPQSTTHDEYSLNGNPNMPNLPTPSLLDLDGVTPPKYLDNPPT
jgi:hypothetical protein|tara:strand:+ start:57 stop:272 length:216 start_codon:yes stop_codon:yes gene_type:complete